MSKSPPSRESICCYAQHAREKVIWQITDRCHLRCAYCFTPGLGRRDLPADEARAVVDRIRARFPWKRRLLFAGREPLLYVPLAEVARYATDNGFLCSVSTSGELLTTNRADELARAGAYKVNVTINAADAEAHRLSRPGASLPRVLDAIRAAAARELLTKVNLTAMPETIDSLGETLQLLRELPVSRLSIGLIHPAGDAPGVRERLRQAVSTAVDEAKLMMPVTIVAPPDDRPCAADQRCPVRGGLLSILPDGTFVGCNIYPQAFEVLHDDHGIVDGYARPDRRAPAGV